MNRLFRSLARAGRGRELWPAALLLLTVIAPAICLLWFMDAAMRNERLAARERLADVYRARLSAAQDRLEEHWRQTAASLETIAATNPPPEAFAISIRSGLVDSVVLFDDSGRVLYPNRPSATNATDATLKQERFWTEGRGHEEAGDFTNAAAVYDSLARRATDATIAARAGQAAVRCWARSGDKAAAIAFIEGVFGQERFRDVADPQGRLIAANVELLALELIQDRASVAFDVVSRRLLARLADYRNPALASPQRRFLMNGLERLAPSLTLAIPTREAERTAEENSQLPFMPGEAGILHPARSPGYWQFGTRNRRILALVQTNRFQAVALSAIAPDPALTKAGVTILAPDADVDTARTLVTLSAAEQMPGWRWALALEDETSLGSAAGRTALYVWTAMAVMGGMIVLALAALRLVHRQLAVARLKNDLAATVSHELRTPIAATRVLVDTLLDANRFDEQTTRDYLQLIARENERLSRLIENFLSFSRMERGKERFEFSRQPVDRIVDAAVETVRARFTTPGCPLEVRLEGALPPIMADPDALTTALINLLENAIKYSDDRKPIAVRARADRDRVELAVQDNGIGIARRERSRIFQPFYQVDRRLSRHGAGCGLGLSIVQYIVTAHDGRISVDSEPGRGSVFTISIPVAPN